MKPAALALLLAVSSASATDLEVFESEIRPILASRCFACHAQAEMSGLRLDSRERMLRGGSRGPAVVPGKPAQSLLLAAVKRDDESLSMPPTEPLGSAEVAMLEDWIAAGALWPSPAARPSAVSLRPQARDFWSFSPLRRPAVPDGSAGGAIDQFVERSLRQAGLEPAPAADKRTLIRRLKLQLHGLPPTPDETDAFLSDTMPGSYSRLVDRLLGSPRYGERMARHWLDLARYADGQSAAYADTPLENAWRYRDWVVAAFNRDLPYDRFIVLQLAADLVDDPDQPTNLAALGFHALRDRDDDRVDVTGRTFLGLTVGCAQCHDHKFDPIPQADFYAWQGVFTSSEPYRHPLAPRKVVEEYEAAAELVRRQKLALEQFLKQQRDGLIDLLMERTADYLAAAYRVSVHGEGSGQVATEEGLDLETLDRWIRYLRARPHEHPYLDAWHELAKRGSSPQVVRQTAAEFQEVLLAIHREKRALDDRNYVKLGGAEGARTQKTLLNTNLEFLKPVRYYLWRDMAVAPGKKRGLPFAGGVYHYGPQEIERFLGGVWREHLDLQKEKLERLQDLLPPQYPFLHAYRDARNPKDARIAIRGNKADLGAAVPRRFLTVLSADPAERFLHGSGRLELAEAIASRTNPLTPRVLANRLWQWRFGRGLVATPSNFGQLGERPTHPELLDWLAAELVDSDWSVKRLDRTILLSDAYRRSSTGSAENAETDPENALLWRFNPAARLDAETLRDSLLAVAGRIDLAAGGPPGHLAPGHRRRTIYGAVNRTNPDPGLLLFDFPDAKSHSPLRDATVGPLQRLYYLNNPFFTAQAAALAHRLESRAGSRAEERVRAAHELLFSRPPEDAEVAAALDYLRSETWPQYCQVLLASSEFLTVR